MAQLLWSSYYYKPDAKLKARYLEKVSFIKRQEDPYALKKADFCRDASQLPSLAYVLAGLTGRMIHTLQFLKFF